MAAAELRCVQVPESFDANVLPGDWERLPAVQLAPSGGLAPRDLNDISAKVALAWNSRYIFVVALVVDDIFRPADSMSGFWNGDSIQFAFDAFGATSREQTFHFGAADFPFGRKVLSLDVPRDYLRGVVEAPFNVWHDGARIIYVVALPWSFVGTLNPLLDEPFRFNLIVNENDGASRRGWVQLSDGIGTGLDASKFQAVRFERNRTDPMIHVCVPKHCVDLSETVDVRVTARNVAPGTKVRMVVGHYREDRDISARQDACQMTMSVKPGKIGHVGESTVRAELVDEEGHLLTQASTVVIINDRQTLAADIEQARESLTRIDAIIRRETAKGRVTDYFALRANCLRYALRVADLAQTEISNHLKASPDYEELRVRVARYAGSAAPKLLDDLQEYAARPGAPHLAIPRPDLYRKWTIKNGNIYAGSDLITLNGVCWLYGHKDPFVDLCDLGMNMQTIDMGPSSVVGNGFDLKDDLRDVDVVQMFRRAGLDGEKKGEVFELHTSPHYVPPWFQADNHNAWMDTPGGRHLLELTYRGLAEALGDIKAIRTADLANEWTFWSTSREAMDGFRNWLRDRHGSVERLNQRWGTGFKSFREVPEPFPSVADNPRPEQGVYQPLGPEGIYKNRGPYWDWCEYNTQRAASVVKWMNTTLKKHFPALLTQIKCVLSSREYRGLIDNFILGIDPQKILPITDFIGTDASYIRGNQWKGTLFSYDYLKSIAPDKPIVCTESHSPPYYDSSAPSEIRRGFFQRFVHGERLNLVFLMVSSAVSDWWGEGFEGQNMSSWNVGACPETLESIALTFADLRRHQDELCLFSQRKPDLLLFYDNAADFGVPGSDDPPGKCADSLLPIYESLIYRDVRIGFVTERMLQKQIPKVPLIVLADARFVSDNTVKALMAYVKSGGRLLLAGDNLQWDDYGQKRRPNALQNLLSSDRVCRVPLLSAVDYEKVWSDQLAAAGITTPFTTAAKSEECVWGLEILSASLPGGKSLVFLANTNPAPVELSLRHSGSKMSFLDLVSGESVDPGGFVIPGNGVMLLRGTPLRTTCQQR